jgi:hypothetical protein
MKKTQREQRLLELAQTRRERQLKPEELTENARLQTEKNLERIDSTDPITLQDLKENASD